LTGDLVTADACPIGIIGAGFAGLAMAMELKQAGIDSFKIYEAAAELGGTWRDNTYPGCACDIPSHLYSLRDVPLPGWSRSYSPQPEILEYLKQVAREQKLESHIVYNTEISEVIYNDADGLWTLKTANSEDVVVRAVVFGIGALNVPNIPDIAGVKDFEGRLFHSNIWPKDLDLKGKKVAIVGTGASAIQIIPQIAPDLEHLTVYQRTPPWIVPRFDRNHSKLEIFLFRYIPFLLTLYRLALYWSRESLAYFFVTNPQASFPEILARKFLRSSVADPELREKLTPNYKLGCKRVLVSDDYLPAMQRSNVTLVTQGIETLTKTGIRTTAGTDVDYDVIIMATGFRVFDKMYKFQAQGRGGLALSELWKDRVEAYFGITVSGFPNFFIILGPNTALGHNSVVLMIEAQVGYIKQCIARLRDKNLKSIEVQGSAQNEFNVWLRKRIASTIWLTGCASWYLDENGHNPTIWPGYVFQYQWRTRKPAFQDFNEEQHS
jgi:cation diffusion facilitator CzcD-associated flavoprotein CzcO